MIVKQSRENPTVKYTEEQKEMIESIRNAAKIQQ